MKVRSDGFIDLSYQQKNKCFTLNIPKYIQRARDGVDSDNKKEKK